MNVRRGGRTALLRELADGRWVVGGAAAAIVVWSSSVRDLPSSLPLILAVGAATLIIYGVDAWLDRRSAPLPSAVRRSFPLALIVLVAALRFLRPETVLTLLGGLTLCALYAVPLPGLRGRRPKDHPAGKVLSVAASVAIATTLLPAVESKRPPGLVELFGLIVLTGGLIAWNTLACDLRDSIRDRQAGLRTAATSWGSPRLRRALQVAAVGGITTIVIAASALPTSALTGAVLCAAIPLIGGLAAVQLLRPETSSWIWTWTLDGSFWVLLCTPIFTTL